MATPEWDFWLNMATWEEGNAVLLALNTDPLTPDSRELHRSDELVQKMGRLFVLLKNHDEAGNFSRRLDCGLSPHEFATFFVKIGWPIPQELAALAVNAPQAALDDIEQNNDKYQSPHGLIQAHINKLFDELPEKLRKFVKDEFPIPWNSLSAAQRLEFAEQYDCQHDPALNEENKYWWNLYCKIDETKKKITEWELMNHQYDPVKAKIRDDKLHEFHAELEVLNNRCNEPFTAKVKTELVATSESVGQSAPAAKMKEGADTTPGDTAAYDEKLAALFNPVPVETLAKMFNANGKWTNWAERASRNGLKDAAKEGRGKFNPYKAAVWFVSQGIDEWDLARCYRVLANNLPARSLKDKHLLTGDID